MPAIMKALGGGILFTIVAWAVYSETDDKIYVNSLTRLGEVSYTGNPLPQYKKDVFFDENFAMVLPKSVLGVG